MSPDDFTGDRKAPMVSPLAAVEKRFIQANIGKVPAWIETNHLTLLTLVWTGGMLLCGLLARRNIHFLWGSSLMLFLQWFTDCFDGAIGRHRDTGLRKWGYYMDHFLDFVFMASIFVGYAFLVGPPGVYWVLFAGFLYACLEVNSFLEFGATGSFKITQLGMGPTEVRLLFIIVNTIVIFTSPRWLAVGAPWFCALVLVMLVVIVCRTHKTVWAIDMREHAAMKKEAERNREG